MKMARCLTLNFSKEARKPMQNKKKTIRLSNDLLEDIAMAMNENSHEMTWYLDIQKEETTFVSDLYDEDETLREMIENDYGERFISIPVRSSHEGWRQMERFIILPDNQDEKARDLLLATIQGSGAFGRFKDYLYRSGLHEQWFEFKDREDRKYVLDWLCSLDLIAGEDIEKGMQLYEEWLAKRNQHEKDIANMTTGTQVKCIYNDGHTDKLTTGKTYEVLDERKIHLNIRIRDDRGKVCWLPKSHFELLHIRKV